MSLAKSQAATTRELRHRVLTCLNKLSDRDTYSSAASELEVIAKNLRHDSIPLFISSISATDTTDKSPVRKQCLRLISLVSESHGDALSPYLSKLISAVVRRLRDPDSAVRSACVTATASISSHITKPPFMSVAKPLVDALVTEQDINSQIGAALCLASAIDGSPNPDTLYLKKLLLRLERLLKCDSFRAKPALLTLVGSVIGAGAASTVQTLRNLVPLLVEFIRCDDWAARKAAAETLMKLAVVDRDVLPEFKAACLRTFEAKKFDKVKSVRESMNQLVETWKEIPDVSDEVPLPEPQSSTKEDASGGQYPPGSNISCTITSGAPQMRKKSTLGNRSALPDGSFATTARKASFPDSMDKRPGPAMFRKLDGRKSLNWKIEIASPHAPSTMVVYDDEPRGRDESLEKGEKLRSRFTKPETRRALFNKNADNKMLKFDGAKPGSRVVPCHDADSEPTGVVSNTNEDVHRNQTQYEDISLIRKQLVHIENQQSNLLDLLQKFMGSSQDGMRSLETRVYGLELALDEISYDLAVTSGRMSKTEYEGTTCCKLPGAEFFTPKFWRKNEPRHSTPSGDTLPTAPNRNMANNNSSGERFKLQNRRFQRGGGGGFIMNPLAEVRSLSHAMPEEGSSNRVSNNVQGAA